MNDEAIEKQYEVIIGRNIKRILKERKIKQREAAVWLGLDESALSKYIRGLRLPKLVTVIRFINHTGCTFEELTKDEAAV